MAVVSISRIQVRRGKKEQGEGLPQLASGEFGWAIDAQELYIGNGAVSEGAPAIGNTLILTEHSNLFELGNYTYLDNENIQTGVTPNNAVYRTLQSRLDDRVSVRAFGAEGNGTDQAVELQRAIDQLFLNPATRANPASRVILWIEAGLYKISNTIYIPPFATIVGAGINKTIIETTGEFAAFKTVDGSSTIGNYSDGSTNTLEKQARNILLSNMTVDTSTATENSALHIDSCRDSIFENLSLKSSWEYADSVLPDTPYAGVILTSISSEVTCKNNLFKNVHINGYNTGINARYDVRDNIWEKCQFTQLRRGAQFGTTSTGFPGLMLGPMNNVITNSVFDNILNQGIQVINGSGNLSLSNRYYNVGNEGGSPSNNTHSAITVADPSNASIGDWFARSQALSNSPNYLFGVPYVEEVNGPVITDFDFTLSVSVSEQNQFGRLFKLPASNARGYTIDYVYRSESVPATRSGVLIIAVDPFNNSASLSDEYTFAGSPEYAENLEFSTVLLSEDNEVVGGNQLIDSMAVTMINTTDNDVGRFYYKVRSKT